MTRAIAIAALVMIGFAPRAGAQPAAAQAAFDNGRKLMDAGRYDEACVAFEQSWKIDPQIGTRYNLALCYDKTGRNASAWAAFTEVAQRDTRGARQVKAAKRAAELAPTLTRMRIDVGEPGLQVSANGVDVTSTIGVDAPVDPGKYHLEARAPGKQPWSADVETLGAGQTLSVRVPPLTASAAEPPPPDEPPPRVAATAPVHRASAVGVDGALVLPLGGYTSRAQAAFGVFARLQRSLTVNAAVGVRAGFVYELPNDANQPWFDVPIYFFGHYLIGSAGIFATADLGVTIAHTSGYGSSSTTAGLGFAGGPGYRAGRFSVRLEGWIPDLSAPGTAGMMANVGYDVIAR